MTEVKRPKGKLTMVYAPLSHNSFTNFFRARGVCRVESMKADKARVSCPSVRLIISSSRKDLCQVALTEPKSVSVSLI
jgi:hypothetical protein